MLEVIEQELRTALPSAAFYFDTLFSWLKSTNQAGAIKSMSLQAGKPERALLYAFLFFQVSEQIKIGCDAALPAVWKYLFNKLAACHYFSAERAEEIRLEMEPYL